MKEFGIFTVILPFLFIFLVAYGILSYIKPFGDDKYVNSILAFIIAFMAIQFLPILIFVQMVVPYIFALFLIVFLALLLFRFMGVKEDSVQEALAHPDVFGVIIAVLIIGIFVFVSESFPELSISTQGETSITDSLGGVYTGEQAGSDSGSVAVVTQTDEGTVTVLPEDEVAVRQDFLRNTIFHPTILSILVMFIMFGVAAYYVVVIKEA